MGIIKKLLNSFCNLFDLTSKLNLDDSKLLSQIHDIPQSLPAHYKKIISDIEDQIHKVYETANDREFTLGVIGDFSVGKSSFVNAVLGNRILPVSAKPTTAIISKIKYGSTQKVIVRYNDGHEREMSYNDFLEFSAFTLEDFKERDRTGRIHRFERIRDAIVYVKSDFLKRNKLCIVDTLGLSAHDKDNKLTLDSIKESIAIIYVCGERGMTENDVSFIAEYLNPERDDFFVCVNRIDLVRKSERDEVIRSVKLKIDDILEKKGLFKRFDLSHVYPVSSLYQDFANGFTDHEDYQEGKQYMNLSGFGALMNDVGTYIGTNADLSRLMSVNIRLNSAKESLSQLKMIRESEYESEIRSLTDKINLINEKLFSIGRDIDYIKSQFDGFVQKIRSLTSGLYADFCRVVNSGWESTHLSLLTNKLSFGFTDYMALKKDILVLKLNIFKSMTDKRYAELHSIAEFVSETIKYLKVSFTPVSDKLADNVQLVMTEFSKNNVSLFDSQSTRHFPCDVSYVISYDEVVWATYRAVAKAAVETMWNLNKNRRIKMLNAAKSESLQKSNKALTDAINKYIQNVEGYIHNCEETTLKPLVKDMNNLNRQISILKSEIQSNKKRKTYELEYFLKSIEIIAIEQTNLKLKK